MSAFNFLFVWLFFVLATTHLVFCKLTSNIPCIEYERQALLEFKKDLHDPSNRISSWGADPDCCHWAGVVCNNSNGHVAQLHLQNPFSSADTASEDVSAPYNSSMLDGKINRSILKLKHLHHLDLSGNGFFESEIPSFLGSITTLRYLNFSTCRFIGMVPPQLGNLTNLQFLDLGRMYYSSGLYVQNLHWLANLSSLEYLDLSFVYLSKSLGWEVISSALPSLTHLDLSYCQLDIPSVPAVNFSSLSFLDLSFNIFHNVLIPQWIFRLSNLVFINLESNSFEGPIPIDFRNMTFLKHLNLRRNNFRLSKLNWFYSLKTLEYLDFSDIFQEKIPVDFGNMTFLKYLDLSNNNFRSSISNWLYNFKMLEYLDLSNNNFKSFIPNSLYNNKMLEYLDLSNNFFEGRISESISNLSLLNTIVLSYNSLRLDERSVNSLGYLCNLRRIKLSGIKLNQHLALVFQSLSLCISTKLEALYLDHSQLFGQFEDVHLESFQNLIYLDLSVNAISGTIPISFGQLSSLWYMDISYNSLQGIISEVHFINLTRLYYFHANGNQLHLSVDSNWVPPFQLRFLYMGSWHLGPQFPRWLHSQKYLKSLNMSHSSISDTIPGWFWNSQLILVNLSNNHIHGELPNQLWPVFIDLSSNQLKGQLPYVSLYMSGLNLFNNSLSGSLSHFLCRQMNETMKMRVLQLGNNFLSGEIPNCWTKWKQLNVLELSNNNFTGSIPNSVGNLKSLQSLRLQHNRLSGEIPSSLKSCTELINIDLAENQLEGEISGWIGKNLQNLVILNLRSNKFHGGVTEELCQLTSLRILVMAYNNFSGSMPKCIHNFTAMITANYSENLDISYQDVYMDVMEVMLIMMKGSMLEYSTNLNMQRIIDMSCNNLSGNIPPQITKLHQLQSLNLSHNSLTGLIPQDIGELRSLESLDLCGNHLFGEIPQSISNLNFLSQLNLSNNDLEGRIPTSTQLQGFDASSFSGNKLWGLPLTRSCNKSNEINGTRTADDEGNSDEGLEMKWFYIGMAYGFGVGFWIVVGSLAFFRKWRHLFFKLLDMVWVRLRFGCM